MKITRVVQLENGYYEVHFDTAEPIKVHEESLVKYELLPNTIIGPDRLEEVKASLEYDRAYVGAITYISYKIRSKDEIKTYLRKVFPETVVLKTVGRLEQEGYIDDRHYGEALRNTIFNTTDKGPMDLYRKLKDKNIEQSIIDENVEIFSEQVDEERILKIYNKELRKHRGSKRQFDMKIRERLMRRGYLKIHESFLPKETEFDDGEYFEKDFEKYYNRYSKKDSGFKLKQRLIQAMMRRGYSYDRISEKLGGIEDEFFDNDES